MAPRGGPEVKSDPPHRVLVQHETKRLTVRAINFLGDTGGVGREDGYRGFLTPLIKLTPQFFYLSLQVNCIIACKRLFSDQRTRCRAIEPNAAPTGSRGIALLIWEDDLLVSESKIIQG